MFYFIFSSLLAVYTFSCAPFSRGWLLKMVELSDWEAKLVNRPQREREEEFKKPGTKKTTANFLETIAAELRRILISVGRKLNELTTKKSYWNNIEWYTDTYTFLNFGSNSFEQHDTTSNTIHFPRAGTLITLENIVLKSSQYK